MSPSKKTGTTIPLLVQNVKMRDDLKGKKNIIRPAAINGHRDVVSGLLSEGK